MFNHVNTIDIPELQTLNENNSRFYITPTGEKYPSVTTLLGWSTRKSIYQWRQRVGEQKANRISGQSSARGTRYHNIVEKYLRNEDVSFSSPLDKDLFNSTKNLLSRINNINLLEKTLYSDHLKSAGRVDCIGEFDNKLSVIDFKTSSQPKTENYITNYFMQGSAYAVMFEERTGIPISNIVIIMAVEGNEAQLFQTKRDNYIEQFKELRKRYENENTK